MVRITQCNSDTPHQHEHLCSPIGRYSDQLGATSPCTQCPPGRFGTVEGLTSASCSGSDGTGFACPPGYLFFNDGGNDRACFKVSTDRKTWVDAEAACVAEGAHLASVSSRATIEFLWQQCEAAQGGSVDGIQDAVSTS